MSDGPYATSFSSAQIQPAISRAIAELIRQVFFPFLWRWLYRSCRRLFALSAFLATSGDTRDRSPFTVTLVGL